MTKFRICSIQGFTIEPVLTHLNGWWRAEAVSAVGWGKTERQAIQSLIATPPFDGANPEIVTGDETSRFELAEKVAFQEKCRNDWRSTPPTLWQIMEHGKRNYLNMSTWDYRTDENDPVCRVVATVTTVSVRWKVIGASSYEVSQTVRKAFWRPSLIDGMPVEWPKNITVIEGETR